MKIDSMASLQSSLLQFPSAISSLTMVLLLSLLPSMLSQDTSSSNPTIAQCTSQLLPLAACASFVQGTSQQPAQSCCGNLKLLYSQQPTCLCLLLNGTNLSLFPINATRALQLPGLCSLQVDTSACSGAHVPPSSPSSEVSFGTNTNSTAPKSTIASSPMAQSAPRPSTMGLGFGRNANAATKMKLGGYLSVALGAASFLVAEVPLWMRLQHL